MRYALCLLAMILPLSLSAQITNITQEGSFDATIRKQINDNFSYLYTHGSPSGNATSIQSITVCSTAPTDTFVLTYSLADGCWKPLAATGGITGSGTAGYYALFAGAAVVGVGALTDDNTNVSSTEPIIITASGAGALKFSSPLHVAGLASCASGTLGTTTLVDDATSKTPGAAAVGSGPYSIRVQCILDTGGPTYSWIID